MQNRTGVVAFAFGTPSNIPSNRAIASSAHVQSPYDRSGCSYLPVYTQSDIQFYRAFRPETVTYIYEEEGDLPPPTLRIAREAVLWAKDNGFTVLMVSAAEPHMHRCIRDLKAVIREKGFYIEVNPIASRYQGTWFCKESTQRRTRSWLAWWPRELFLRCLPFFIYDRIAS